MTLTIRADHDEPEDECERDGCYWIAESRCDSPALVDSGHWQRLDPRPGRLRR